jgi:NAD(P)-dependent dehydrogenase (short-subunit alcohol dehydrogenase family)
VAVVTGAASGIGRALALCLAGRGAHVAAVDVQGAELEETVARVQALGVKASAHVVDVADRAAMQALPEAVLAAHGRVDLLLNNAGIAAGYRFEDHPIEHFERILGVNLLGVVYGCKFFLPHLQARPEAHIVNISSIFGLIGYPTQAAYSASKFAVRGLSEVLWVELAASSVRVTCVFPGGVHTNIVRSAPGWMQGVEVAQREFDQVVRRTPEQAARRIVRAIERDTPQLRLGVESYLIDWLKRLFPRGLHRWLATRQRAEARAKAKS